MRRVLVAFSMNQSVLTISCYRTRTIQPVMSKSAPAPVATLPVEARRSPSSSSSSSENDSPITIEPHRGGEVAQRVFQRKTSMGNVFEDVQLFAEIKLGESSSVGANKVPVSPDAKSNISTEHNLPIWSVSVSNSGILCGCDDGSIYLLTCNLMVVARIEKAHRGVITLLEWSSNGVNFLSAGSDLCVRVWAVEAGGVIACKQLLRQNSRVVGVGFSKFDSNTIFTLTQDNRINLWVSGQMEMYEALPASEAVVCLAIGAAVPSNAPTSTKPKNLLAIGTKHGELLLYEHSEELGILFLNSLACRNRRGIFKDGTPIVSIVFINNSSEILVSTNDNRIRLVRVTFTQKIISPGASMKSAVNIGGSPGRNASNSAPSSIYSSWRKSLGPTQSSYAHPTRSVQLSVLQKFRGHKSSSGEAPLGAYLLATDSGTPVLQSGSEDGKIYSWLFSTNTQTHSNPFKRFARRFKQSRALKNAESWNAVNPPDKLTAVTPATWAPSGTTVGTCTVACTLHGWVKVFIAKTIVKNDAAKHV